MNEINLHQPGNVTIDSEFAEMLQETAKMLVSASAVLSASATHVERHCPYVDDPIITDAVQKMRLVSGDLAVQWESFDQALAGFGIAA